MLFEVYIFMQTKKGAKDKMKKTAIILMCVMLGGVLFGCSGNTVPMSGGGTPSNLFDRRMSETEDSQGGSGAIPKNGGGTDKTPNNKSADGNKSNGEKKMYSDNILGRWYGFGSDPVVVAVLDVTPIDAKTVKFRYSTEQADRTVTFVSENQAESNVDSNDNRKMVYIFGSSRQGAEINSYLADASTGKQVGQNMYHYRNAVWLDTDQTIQDLTKNGDSVEVGYFKDKYNRLDKKEVTGSSQMELNQNYGSLRAEWENLESEIFNCVIYMSDSGKAAELKSDEERWNKETDAAVAEEEANYFMRDENGKVIGRGSVAPMQMNIVKIERLKSRCKYLISLIK